MSDIKNHVVNFSGGRTSGFMVDQMEKKAKKEGLNVTYVFSDTGAEHPATYQFIRDVVKHWDINLVCLRAKIDMRMGVGPTYERVKLEDCKPDLKPFLDACMKHGTPTVKMPYCTDKLKTIPTTKFCNKTLGAGNYIQWLGMRIDEPARIKETEEQLDLFGLKSKATKQQKMTRYLAGISDYTKEDVLDWWSKQPFDLGIDEHLGNCVFCVKKNVSKVALAAKNEPEMATKFMDMIATDGMRLPPDRTDAKEIMYRGNMSLASIIASFEDVQVNDLANRIKMGRNYDSGNCSSSCESAIADPDLFDV